MRLISFLIALFLVTASVSAEAARVKDIAAFDGVRDNQLVGYGLVVGLNGSGDSDQTKFPVQSLVNVLERMGVTINRSDVKVKNVAAVMVTATLPPFAKQGNRLDVLVSSLGDAKTLAGGTLVMTPLRGADNHVYAVAQGSLLTNSFAFGGKGASATQGHLTAGQIPSGALVERELPNVLAGKKSLRLNLMNSDFTTASRVAAAINAKYRDVASTIDGASVTVMVPDEFHYRPVDFIASIENLDVKTDNPSRVVVNERTGTIVMGSAVRISSVAVSHGTLSLTVKEPAAKAAKQAQPAQAAPKPEIKAEEEMNRLAVLTEGATIGEIIRGLNILGVTPRDLISILQAIKAAGALQAELVII